MSNGLPRRKVDTDSVQTMADRGDLRPIPDPTVLTTQAQIAATAALREIIEIRLDGMDKAVVLVKENVSKFPAFVEATVGSLEKLINEKLGSINNQFTLRDVAVAAALKAAQEAVFAQQVANKEANNKMEVGFEKRIVDQATLLSQTKEQLGDKIDTRFSAMDTRTTSLEARFSAMEIRGQGRLEDTTERKRGNELHIGWFVGFGGMLIGVGAIIVEVFHK